MAIPLSSGEQKYLMIQVPIGIDAGLESNSYLDIPQMRAMDKERFKNKIGKVPLSIYHDLFKKINIFLGFDEYLRK